MSKEQLNTLQTPKFMRAKELAKHLGIGLSTVWFYSKQGKIKPIKLSERVTVFNVACVWCKCYTKNILQNFKYFFSNSLQNERAGYRCKL